MPRKRPAILKRELKRMTRARIQKELEAHGLECEEMTAGSIKYTVARFMNEPNQIVAAIYGSIKDCASIWVKEAAFQELKPELLSSHPEATVEDVSLFRRGFQWSVHIKSPDDPLIMKVIDKAVLHGQDRLNKTIKRRAEDTRREQARAEREAAMAERKRDWKSE